MKCQLHPPSTRTIFGMIPWMFWTLLATVLFFLFAPFAAVLLRADPMPPGLQITSDPTPLTTEWVEFGPGTVLNANKRPIRIGLRSDGVVVWREVKP